jgi:hypothetical protein
LEAIRIPRSIEDADDDRRRPTLERAALASTRAFRGISHGYRGEGWSLFASLDTSQLPARKTPLREETGGFSLLPAIGSWRDQETGIVDLYQVFE